MFSKKKKVSSEVEWGKKVSDVVRRFKICTNMLEHIGDDSHTTVDLVYDLKRVFPSEEVNNIIKRMVNKKKQELLYELKQLKGGK